MGRSRYPRPGHRLAPATLAELLQDPVPAGVLPGDQTGLKLCDLDETSWERFDERVCRELGAEVIRAISRVARNPTRVAQRLLPPLPQGLGLDDLQLEVRTFNCLAAAGLGERPQDIGAMTVEAALALKGFWVKCLIDLLTSLEFAIDHPEAVEAPGGRAARARSRSDRKDRYPRRGYRVAPKTLKEILTERIPERLAKGTPLAGRRLWQLDETVWRHLGAKTIQRLAETVVARVGAGACSQAVRRRRLPKLPEGAGLDDLRLENRTRNCLRRGELGRRLEEGARCTVGEVLKTRAFGARCLVDLLCSLETLAARRSQWGGSLAAEAAMLKEIPEAAAIHFRDPRFGPLLRATDRSADTVCELLDHLVRGELDGPGSPELHESVGQVRRRVAEALGLPLERELTEIFAAATSRRDREILAAYYGWDGRGGTTLEHLGRKHRLSRERIRQICVRATKRGRAVRAFAPVLDRAVAFLNGRLPRPVDDLQREFDAAGFSACGMRLESVRQAAALLGRQVGFAVVSAGRARLAVPPDCASLPKVILHTARRELLSQGATTIARLAKDIARETRCQVPQVLVLATLRTLPDFQWLDERGGWFQLDTQPQFGLRNIVEKVLSVCRGIDVDKLREAMTRYRRTDESVPPPGVLLEFCRRIPGVRVERRRIVAQRRRDWRKTLAAVEAGMVGVLRKHGPLMERGELEERCAAAGVNRFSFNAILMCSPVIEQFGRGVYGLLGARPNRRTIAALCAQRHKNRPPKVLTQFGETEDGKVYLGYRLSKAAISGGVITVPSAVKARIGGRYRLRTHDGNDAGTLVSKNGCAWGLGPALRGQAAEPGDEVLLLFDLDAGEAVLHVGNGSQTRAEPAAAAEG